MIGIYKQKVKLQQQLDLAKNKENSNLNKMRSELEEFKKENKKLNEKEKQNEAILNDLIQHIQSLNRENHRLKVQEVENKRKIEKLGNEYENIKTMEKQYKQKRETPRLNDELKETRKAHQINSDEILKENAILSQQNEEHKQQILSLEDKVKKLEKNIGLLLDDKKELELENVDLKNVLKRLKIKQIDIRNYKNWQSQDIVDWIMSLENGRYIRYESILKQSLYEEEVSGIDLEKVSEIDVKSWGIKKFSDKKDLTQQIRNLTQQNQVNNNDNNMIHGIDEGVPTAYIHH